MRGRLLRRQNESVKFVYSAPLVFSLLFSLCLLAAGSGCFCNLLLVVFLSLPRAKRASVSWATSVSAALVADRADGQSKGAANSNFTVARGRRISPTQSPYFLFPETPGRFGRWSKLHFSGFVALRTRFFLLIKSEGVVVHRSAGRVRCRTSSGETGASPSGNIPAQNVAGIPAWLESRSAYLRATAEARFEKLPQNDAWNMLKSLHLNVRLYSR